MKLQSRRIRNSDIIVHYCKTNKPGPTIAITSNIHGDECNGVAVVHKLLENSKDLICGSLVLYPSLNPRGLKQMVRSLPGWKQDINRRFPGNNSGDNLDRHVALIWKDLASYQLSAVIDLHTDSGNSCPYVLVDRVINTNESLQRSIWELASVTGLFAVWEYRMKEYKQFHLDKSLAGAILNRMKIPSITIEVGPRRFLNASSVMVGYNSVIRVLHHYKMVEKAPSIVERLPRGIWRRKSGPTAISDGLILPIAKPGEILKVCDPIATIINEEGLLQEEINTDEVMVVLSFPDNGYIQAGQTVCTIAVAE